MRIRFGGRFLLILVPLALALFYVVIDNPAVHDSEQPGRVKQVRKYREQVNRLQNLLATINRQVDSSGNGYTIQNSLLELRQEWLLTDVIARTTNDQRIETQHPSAERLRTLYNLCFPVYEAVNREAVLQEINQLQKRVDVVD